MVCCLDCLRSSNAMLLGLTVGVCCLFVLSGLVVWVAFKDLCL